MEKNLSAALGELQVLLSGNELADALAELKDLRRWADTDVFRITIVSGHLTGKSAVFNSLVGRELVPEQSIPFEDVRVSLTYGTDNSTFLFANKASSQMPTAIVPWDKALRSAQPLKEVQITLGDEWMEEHHLLLTCQESVDRGVLPEKGIDKLILPSDGVLLITSAATPLSLLEKTLLSDMTDKGYVQAVALVVTRLELVPEGQRTQVLDYIRERLASLSVPVPILTIVAGGETIGLHSHIEQWAANDNREMLKASCLSRRLHLLIDRVQEALLSARDKLTKGDGARKEELLKLSYKIEQKKLIWEELRIAVLQRSADCNRLLNKLLEQSTTSLISRLEYELSHSQNPKGWWENDLPYKVKLELDNLIQSLERSLDSRLINDTQWIQGQVKSAFAKNIAGASVPVSVELTPFVNSTPEKAEDITQSRNMARIIPAAVTFGANVLGLISLSFGANALISAVGGVIGDSLVTQKAHEQAAQLATILRNAISKHYIRMADELAVQVRLLYTNILDQIAKNEDEWVRTQDAVVDQAAAYKDPALTKLADLLDQLERIKRKI